MGNKMLIDAAHLEETRVVVCHGNRVEEFDFEAAAKQQLRGNIYLAKVTRVEPSLQAAFVDYGGNRHGFLAFNEIHPDYYQIPVSDREALIAEQQAETSRAAEQDELDDPHIADEDEEFDEQADDEDDAAIDLSAEESEDDNESLEADSSEESDEAQGAEEEASLAVQSDEPSPDADGEMDSDTGNASVQTESVASDEMDAPADEADADPDIAADADTSDAAAPEGEDITASESSEDESGEAPDDETAETRLTEETGLTVETKSSDEIADTEPSKPSAKKERSSSRRSSRPRRRPYKIQEVIKRRQILLVQVVKEERGNKGAALTTYLSLAGRYCVLMPNTARGGGISRKITNARDRKRLKGIANELEIPQGMGLIIRTAGANRTKSEIRRDFDYLMRLWENVRDLTLQSTAPTLVHEEGSLVRRSIRDLYSKEIESILVEGEDGYKEAKSFMRMLMPSHAKNVKRYKDRVPLFQRFQVEQQLDSMFSPTVELPSGGYIVINPTEALVSIDVNSGRATREHNIEDTALKTNLEAAEEVARQLRLRDMAGLIVIDFIDMEDNRNNRAVEKKLKECLRSDRARIQVGRISMFGLLEMSRQRMRAGVLEGSTTTCPHCEGSGLIRSTESTALYFLRAIEEECLKKTPAVMTVKVPFAVANYIVNQKREDLLAMEERYGFSCFIEGDGSLTGTDHTIEREGTAPRRTNGRADEIAEDAEEQIKAEEQVQASDDEEDQERNGKKRRRRRRRRGKKESDHTTEADAAADSDEESNAEVSAAAEDDAEDDEERPKKRRRRGKRGGRRNRSRSRDQEAPDASSDEQDQTESSGDESSSGPITVPITTPADFSFYGPADDGEEDEQAPPPSTEVNGRAETETAPALELSSDEEEQPDPEETEPPVTDDPDTTDLPAASDPGDDAIAGAENADEVGTQPDETPIVQEVAAVTENKPRRRGWWQRRE